MNNVHRFSSFLLLFGLLAEVLSGQTSQVSGRIQDASKAAVLSAKVTLTRTETGDRRQTLSSQEGYYSFPLLLPGNYEMNVEKMGFQTEARTGIKVETGTISTVDIELAVGTISQSVTVDASRPLLQTESAAVAQIVENQTIVDMPLIDRRSSQLTR